MGNSCGKEGPSTCRKESGGSTQGQIQARTGQEGDCQKGRRPRQKGCREKGSCSRPSQKGCREKGSCPRPRQKGGCEKGSRSRPCQKGSCDEKASIRRQETRQNSCQETRQSSCQ